MNWVRANKISSHYSVHPYTHVEKKQPAHICPYLVLNGLKSMCVCVFLYNIFIFLTLPVDLSKSTLQFFCSSATAVAIRTEKFHLFCVRLMGNRSEWKIQKQKKDKCANTKYSFSYELAFHQLNVFLHPFNAIETVRKLINLPRVNGFSMPLVYHWVHKPMSSLELWYSFSDTVLKKRNRACFECPLNDSTKGNRIHTQTDTHTYKGEANYPFNSINFISFLLMHYIRIN